MKKEIIENRIFKNENLVLCGDNSKILTFSNCKFYNVNLFLYQQPVRFSGCEINFSLIFSTKLDIKDVFITNISNSIIVSPCVIVDIFERSKIDENTFFVSSDLIFKTVIT